MSDRIYGEAYYLLIAACGKIPEDIQLYEMSALDMSLAEYRVIPFEFLGDKPNSPAMCISPDYWDRFDAIASNQKSENK